MDWQCSVVYVIGIGVSLRMEGLSVNCPLSILEVRDIPVGFFFDCNLVQGWNFEMSFEFGKNDVPSLFWS